MYNSDAFWLTQWNLNILWGLAWPSVLDDFAACLIQYADNGGLLPRGAMRRRLFPDYDGVSGNQPDRIGLHERTF